MTLYETEFASFMKTTVPWDSPNYDFKNSPFVKRQELVKKYAWAILTDKAIEQLRKYGPFIEVGCGNGYWSFEMQQAGIDTIATDINPVQSNEYGFNKTWPIEVVAMNAIDAAKAYSNRTLLTVWPCYKQSWIDMTLRFFLKSGGKQIVYIGEGKWGCTGNDSFHNRLARCCDKIDEIDIPRWEGINDRGYVYQRKGA